MQTADHPTPAQQRPDRQERTTYGLQLFAVCAALTALALKQAPARMVGDTKLDLAVAPLRLMSRALHLWDPSRDFGVTQNQNYGYLFPMGPFFALGRAIGLPTWAVQRLWWALLLCVAFLGLVRLAEALGIGTRPSRLLGGLAFALSPRVLSTLGPISVESLPYCLAPWVLLPLVRGGAPRRAAARSAVAVLCMGAVNAVAVLAALPPAVLWLLTREPGTARRRLMAWWAGCVLLACTWWLVPLLLLGRYSPPFLDFIESASTTTAVTSLVEVLRGTSDWIAYLSGADGPTWPAGWAFLTSPLVITYTVVVVLAGLAGLLRRDLPERLWLVACVLLGLVALTAGHLGSFTGLLAHAERQQLDGVLAPLRNVHKFDVVLRLPLVLGTVHLVGRLAESSGNPDAVRRQRVVVTLAAAAAVLGAALPAVGVGLAPRHPFVDVPRYWQQTADWLADHRAGGRALLLPGSSFPEYLWGSSNDEPLQALGRSPWAVRGAIPLTPGGTIRALDAVEQRVSVGQPSPGLAAFLARLGVGYVVVRNDLAYGRAGSARPLLVHEALVRSPGISRVASFGPAIGGGVNGAYVDEGLEVRYPAVEVFALARPTPRVELRDLRDVAVVVGGPEALLGLDDRDLLRGRPVLLAPDARGIAGLADRPVLLTDSQRRREVFFGQLTDNRSQTLTRDERFRRDVPAHDYAPYDVSLQTVARYVGARALSASSSASDAGAFGGAHPESSPYAAVDGDPQTRWRSDPGRGLRGAWWQVTLDAARSLGRVTVTLGGPPEQRPGQLRVTTDQQNQVVPVTGDRVFVDLPGTTRTLRVAAVGGRGVLGALDLAEVAAAGLHVTRTLDLPVTTHADVVALDASGDDRRACFALGATSPCSSTLARRGEEAAGLARTLRLGEPGSYRLSLQALPVAGQPLDDLLDGGSGVRVTASSSATSDPAGRPAAAYDGDLETGWRAAPGDHAPSLTVAWTRPQLIRGLTLATTASLAASHPGRVTVVADGRVVLTAVPDRRGRLRLDRPLRATRLELRLRVGAVAGSVDPATGVAHLLPVGVSELGVDGGAVATTSSSELSLPCGRGPRVAVGGVVRETKLPPVSRQALLDRAVVPVAVCGDERVQLGGTVDLIAPSTSTLQPVSMTLVADLPAAGPPIPTTATQWTADRRQVRLPSRPGSTVLAVHENSNAGWHATLGGHRLPAVVLDGWQQGWLVPAGAAATVRLDYAPDRLYRRALLVGGLLALVLIGLAVSRPAVTGASLAAGRTRSWQVLLLGGALVLIGGPLGLLLAVAAGLARRLSAGIVSAAALAAVGVAGLAVVLRPWGTVGYLGRGGLTQALCLTGLAVLWSTLLRGSGSNTGRLRQLIRGRSTNR